METHPLDGWTQVERGTGRQGVRLEITHREDEREWPELCVRYWEGQIQGLVTVRKHEWGGRVERGALAPGGRIHFFKRFSIRGWRYLHKPPRARRTLLHEARLQAAGFLTPQMSALIEVRRFGIVVDSALVAQAVPDSTRLYDLFNPGSPDQALALDRKRQLLVAFGKQVGVLHRAGFYHGDMHASNVLCRMEGETVAFIWTDNEQGRRFSALPFRFRVDDLNQINKYKHRITLSDRMRMWQAYLEEADLPQALAEKVRQRVVARSQRFWRKRGWL